MTHQDEKGEPTSGTVYTLENGLWKARKVPASVQLIDPDQRKVSLGDDVVVSVSQGENDPPVVIASRGKSRVNLMASDPALEGVWRARVERMQWRDADGRIITGGLMLPRNATQLMPLPLVIQPYHYWPNVFTPDGIATTAYAAQPLVSEGIAVLFMDIPGMDLDGVISTPREGPLTVGRIDTAVMELERRGLVNSKRVGLVGFSRGGFMTYYAITHPEKTAFAAAVIADAYTGSYQTYVALAALGNRHSSIPEPERQYGGSFWQNQKGWMAGAPAFNIHRLKTPALFVNNNTNSLQYWIEDIGALRLNRRPFDVLNIPYGDHQLQRPLEREASLTATVDWMKFWLLGTQDSAPTKAQTLARWRKIKSNWESIR